MTAAQSPLRVSFFTWSYLETKSTDGGGCDRSQLGTVLQHLSQAPKKCAFVQRQLSLEIADMRVRKSTFEQIFFFFLWVSDDSWTEGMKAWLWEMNGGFCCQFSKTDFKTSHLLKDTSFFLMEGRIHCTWLLFWLCARWGEGTKKFLVLWSTLCLCISRLIVCLNSGGGSSEPVPDFTLEHGSLIPPV